MLKYLKEWLATRTWNDWYELACKYYEQNGNLDIPYNFKTFNGYEENKHGLNLGTWISNQRCQYHKNVLSKEKIDKLNMLGINFTKYKNREFTWDDAYLLAKAYFEHYGNLEVPTKFRTKNGYEYDEDGYNLYGWLGSQRNLYNGLRGSLYYYNLKEAENSFFDERDRLHRLKTINRDMQKISKLFLIGFIGKKEVNERLNRKVCYEHDLDYDIYKDLLNKIPYQELSSKIRFLENSGVALTENGNLNPIFFMNKKQIKLIYEIEYEDLINEYCLRYVSDNPNKIVWPSFFARFLIDKIYKIY